ncbi:hypothetical protein LINPERPRIM_LOCUS44499 [Linum perenne]
MESVIVILRL